MKDAATHPEQRDQGTTGVMAPGVPDQPGSNSGSGSDETLAALVVAAFPDLPMNNWRIDQSGGDHILLIVENTIVFRFPRPGTHNLDLEIAVLRRLKSTLPVATPSYDYIDPAGRFAGYHYLPGVALTPQLFAALTALGQDELVRSAALFLSALHRLPPDSVTSNKRWPMFWTAAQFGKAAQRNHVPTLANLFPRFGQAIEGFYANYLHDKPPGLVVVHGDLVPEHILLDEQSGRLSGIIDFGDVALGDPAQDFLGFWAYGKETARRVVDLYELGRTDSGLLGRSRNHFIRYRLGQLYEAVRAIDFNWRRAAAEIEALVGNR